MREPVYPSGIKQHKRSRISHAAEVVVEPIVYAKLSEADSEEFGEYEERRFFSLNKGWNLHAATETRCEKKKRDTYLANKLDLFSTESVRLD